MNRLSFVQDTSPRNQSPSAEHFAPAHSQSARGSSAGATPSPPNGNIALEEENDEHQLQGREEEEEEESDTGNKHNGRNRPRKPHLQVRALRELTAMLSKKQIGKVKPTVQVEADAGNADPGPH